MGDVADILGLGGAASTSGRASPVLGGPLGPLQENRRGKGAVVPLKKGKPQGVSREVYALLGSEGLPPEVSRIKSVGLGGLSCRLWLKDGGKRCRAVPSVKPKCYIIPGTAVQRTGIIVVSTERQYHTPSTEYSRTE